MKCPSVNSSDGVSSATSSHLLIAAQSFDDDAWHELVQKYSRRMYRWCRRSGLQTEDAANVVQEALVSVARKLGDFRRDTPRSSFRGWLRRIVDNKIRDHYRRIGRRLDVAIGGTDAQARLAVTALVNGGDEEDTGSGTPVRKVSAHREVAEAVAKTRGAVGARNWKCFWRCAVDGQSAAEVGREFGVSANAVRLVKMRVLRRLRAELGEKVLKQK
jgi:RNA polymerase sigma-70 factor (ECF subfamily)